MAAFDPAMFGLLARNMASGAPSGGLLDFLRDPSRLGALVPGGGFGESALPPNAQPTQGGPDRMVPVGDYQMPQFGNPMPQPMQANAQMQTAAAQPQQQALPSFAGAQQSAGIGDRLSAGLMNFANAGGPLQALAGGIGGLMSGQRNDPQAIAQQNLRAQFAAYKAAGLSPEKAMLATLNPKAAEALLPQIAPSYKPHNVGNTAGAFNEATGEYKPRYTEPKYEKLGPGDNLVSVGGAGGTATTVASGGPEKPPTGYEYADPQDRSKGLKAIPGGPGTHLPAETAGRIAMMETAAAELPSARKVLMEGRGGIGTGVSGALAAHTNIGETGRAQRTVRTAIEGALRAMTGAAAPETEVKRYESMFMPSPFDSKEAATQKLNLLEDFIGNARRLVTQGRGPVADQKPGRSSDPLGIR